MALFAVNTGCRDREVCGLQWEWEVKVPMKEIGSVFLIPGERVKNGEDRLVLLNNIARNAIERQRGKNLNNLVGRLRFERRTNRLKACCSTD
jgi:integrase